MKMGPTNRSTESGFYRGNKRSAFLRRADFFSFLNTLLPLRDGKWTRATASAATTGNQTLNTLTGNFSTCYWAVFCCSLIAARKLRIAKRIFTLVKNLLYFNGLILIDVDRRKSDNVSRPFKSWGDRLRLTSLAYGMVAGSVLFVVRCSVPAGRCYRGAFTVSRGGYLEPRDAM